MRSKDSFLIQIKALSYLIYSNKFIHQLVEVDYKKDIISNKDLADSPNSKKESHKADLLCCTIKRSKLLRKRLLKSFIWIATAYLIPIIGVSLINKSFFLSKLSLSNLFALSSVIAFAWATLGRLGWKGQSWKGDTVFEQLDKNIFWALYWIGSVLASLAFLTYKQP